MADVTQLKPAPLPGAYMCIAALRDALADAEAGRVGAVLTESDRDDG